MHTLIELMGERAANRLVEYWVRALSCPLDIAVDMALDEALEAEREGKELLV